MDDLAKQLTAEALFGPMEQVLVQELAQLCQFHNETPDGLYCVWESTKQFSSRSASFTYGFDAKGLEALKSVLQKKPKARQTPMKRLEALGRFSSNAHKSNKPLTVADAYPARTGKITSETKEQALPTRSRAPHVASKVEYRGPDMDEASRKARRFLDERIDEFAALVKEFYDIPEFGNPSSVTEGEVTVVGRIVMDSDTTSTSHVKLNEASLVLESSRSMATGVRVPLRFDTNIRVRRGRPGTNGFGLFPGAIVALRGRNGGGGWFQATELLTLPPLAPPPKSTKHEPFSMLIASGPYTSEADFEFKPWDTFVKRMEHDLPDVVLLIGPFLDCSHPHIKGGLIDSSPSTLFNDLFVERLQGFLDHSPSSIILLVPSVRDILHKYATFPQCELDHDLLNDPRIKLLPNPCTFELNGNLLGVSSVDILFHLRKDEVFKAASVIAAQEGMPLKENDSMSRLCSHLLEQRSFYPLFPPPLDIAPEVNLDISHSNELQMYNNEMQVPSLVIIPSRLKSFAKVRFDPVNNKLLN
ncbi:hypothetical protein NLI96_g12377 [Meripilus lineatus]|uniref:DNA polymerase alpha subunit B n=1 Tax=Meripilus lineatus TaxID=2056292 RepID=A0AAD5Y888_9APHY|nr:hypothetical protein NLI96_g12377 [Physisporinus lineatus]